MRTVALAARSWREATEGAAGVVPVVLPPPAMTEFGPLGGLPVAHLEACDFLYVNLHGLPDQPYWYGDGYATAVSAREVRELDLLGVVAFVTSCFAVSDGGRPGPMVAALLEAGCGAVICGAKLNYSPAVDALGRWVRYGLSIGMPAGRALDWAKVRIGFEDLIRPTVATKDALQFVVVGDAGAAARRRISLGAPSVGTAAAEIGPDAGVGLSR